MDIFTKERKDRPTFVGLRPMKQKTRKELQNSTEKKHKKKQEREWLADE